MRLRHTAALTSGPMLFEVAQARCRGFFSVAFTLGSVPCAVSISFIACRFYLQAPTVGHRWGPSLWPLPLTQGNGLEAFQHAQLVEEDHVRHRVSARGEDEDQRGGVHLGATTYLASHALHPQTRLGSCVG